MPAWLFVTGCQTGTLTGNTCTLHGTPTGTELTDIGGAYFRIPSGDDPVLEKTPISMFAPIAMGGSGQVSSGAAGLAGIARRRARNKEPNNSK